MALQPGFDGTEPLRGERRERLPGDEHERRATRSWRVAEGTFACPSCDLPVAVGGGVELTAGVDCSYCGHDAPARDFLQVGGAPRPARVRVVATLC